MGSIVGKIYRFFIKIMQICQKFFLVSEDCFLEQIRQEKLFKQTKQEYSIIQSRTRLYAYGNWASAFAILISVGCLLCLQIFSSHKVFLLGFIVMIIIYFVLICIFIRNGCMNYGESKCRHAYTRSEEFFLEHDDR